MRLRRRSRARSPHRAGARISPGSPRAPASTSRAGPRCRVCTMPRTRSPRLPRARRSASRRMRSTRGWRLSRPAAPDGAGRHAPGRAVRQRQQGDQRGLRRPGALRVSEDPLDPGRQGQGEGSRCLPPGLSPCGVGLHDRRGRRDVRPAARRRDAGRAIGHARSRGAERGGAGEGRGDGAAVPACASFDQFTDYEARGQAFRDAVEALG